MPRRNFPPDPVAFLTDPEACAADRGARQDCWLLLKQRRGQPILQEAGDRLHDLEARITGRADLMHVVTEADPEPTPPAGALSEVELARRHAEPRVLAAVARKLGWGGGDAA